MAALTTNTLVRLGRHNLPVLGAAYNKRHESTAVVRDQSSNLAAYRRGRGGRSSFSGKVVTVLGASGQLGKYIVNKLGKIGSQVIVPYRGDPYHVKELKLAGDLGQVLFLPYQLSDEESLRATMQYSNTVINLVGRHYETRNFSFEDVNIRGAQRIARIAREMGVDKFVHFSHLNAQPNPPEDIIKGGSQYLSSKYEGELAVRREFPDAIVFRPSDIYGGADKFLRYYADPFRRSFGFMPLWKKGEETIKMPVFASDVAQGVINALADPEAPGRTYEVVGPDSYKLSELVDFIYRCMRYEQVKRIPLTPDVKIRASLLSKFFPNRVPISVDKLAQEYVNDKTHHLPTLVDLGVPLTQAENRIPFELKMYRKGMSYEESLGEIPDPAPPVAMA